MKVLVIEPHKKPYTQEVEHTLENLQRKVGGLIELIYLDDVAIVVNEEGKLNGLPFNRALRDEKVKSSICYSARSLYTGYPVFS